MGISNSVHKQQPSFLRAKIKITPQFVQDIIFTIWLERQHNGATKEAELDVFQLHTYNWRFLSLWASSLVVYPLVKEQVTELLF